MHGHPETDCYKQQQDLRNGALPASTGSRAPSSAPSTTDFTEQDIARLRRLLAFSGSSSTGLVAYVAGTSS